VARRAWERVAPGVYRIVGAPPTWNTWNRFITAPAEVVAEVREALRRGHVPPPAPKRRPKALESGASERRNGSRRASTASPANTASPASRATGAG
jgi:hypothetical protein